MDLFNYEKEGYFGPYGGTFLPEILHNTVEELKKAFREAKEDPTFWPEYVALMEEYCGRPTPITHLKNLSEKLGGAQIYVKREDLNHTGAHKANNVMGQGLLVKRMGKTRVIAETGAGQHGVATATMAAKFGFEATIYMGAVDVARQRPNVFWMEQMGAKVVPVESGQKNLKRCYQRMSARLGRIYGRYSLRSRHGMWLSSFSRNGVMVSVYYWY
jgi:tryptophan synthase beta chain